LDDLDGACIIKIGVVNGFVYETENIKTLEFGEVFAFSINKK